MFDAAMPPGVCAQAVKKEKIEIDNKIFRIIEKPTIGKLLSLHFKLNLLFFNNRHSSIFIKSFIISTPNE